MSLLARSARPSLLRRQAGALVVSLGLFAGACSSRSPDAPAVPPTAPLAARAAQGPAVTATSPRYGDRGTTLDVRVIGSGFVAGAQATWLLRGVADPAKVRTNSTTYVSSTEVVANITIAGDADLAYWDVQIMAGGKNGVGTESFEVTTAEPLGAAGYVGGMNDAGQVVGTAAEAAYVYDDAFGMLSLGAGQGEAVDPLGTMVLGRDGANAVTAWVRQGATTTYVPETLPKLATAVGGNAVAAARDAAGDLIVGGWQMMPAIKKGGTTQNRPVIWRRGTGWSAPIPLVLPAGSTTGAVREINGKGQAVGRLDQSAYGAIWEDASTVTRLDGLPSGINAAGTLAVGAVGGKPAYWYRTATGAWSTGIVLPSLSGTCGGDALGVNDDGVVVGKSCEGTTRIQATLWRLDLSGAVPVLVSGPQRLPGLGVKSTSGGNESSSAVAVTSTAPYVIVGTAASSAASSAAVRWRTW